MLNIEKLAQLAAYLLRKYGGRLNCVKLMRLLYLADRASFNAINHSMTGDAYYALAKGPVLSGLHNLIRRVAEPSMQAYWDARFTADGADLVALSLNIPCGKLSRFEMRTLDELDAQFHDKDANCLVEYMRKNCPEWREPASTGSNPIAAADILAALGRSERDIALIEAENAAYEREDALMASIMDDDGQEGDSELRA